MVFASSCSRYVRTTDDRGWVEVANYYYYFLSRIVLAGIVRHITCVSHAVSTAFFRWSQISLIDLIPRFPTLRTYLLNSDCYLSSTACLAQNIGRDFLGQHIHRRLWVPWRREGRRAHVHDS